MVNLGRFGKGKGKRGMRVEGSHHFFGVLGCGIAEARFAPQSLPSIAYFFFLFFLHFQGDTIFFVLTLKFIIDVTG